MPLASQIKELGAILQKLIKFEPGLNPDRKNETNETKGDGVDGDADNFLRSVGSVQRRKRKRKMFFHKN